MNFLKNYNNGVTALISEEDAKLFALALKSGGDPLKAGVRVFTFSREERLASQPGIFTASDDSLDALLKAGGHQIIEGRGSGWDGYVPFSNGTELQKTADGQPTEAAQEELRWRTTTEDVVKIFLK